MVKGLEVFREHFRNYADRSLVSGLIDAVIL
jgi:hypothetical protein